MNLKIKKLKHKDFKRVINYAINEMHLDIYYKSKLMSKLYGRYYVYEEFIDSTQTLALYDNNEFIGVLFANMNTDNRRKKEIFFKKLYIKLYEFLFGNTDDSYNYINKKMLETYEKRFDKKLDGKINFLLVKPEKQRTGIGSMLLNEFEKDKKGKSIYLFTDDQCIYQFYENRNFQLMDEEIIHYDENNVFLKCLLFVKKIK